MFLTAHFYFTLRFCIRTEWSWLAAGLLQVLILKICISDWNLTEHIGLSRRRGQQLVPVRDIHLAQTQGKIRLGFNGVAFSEKYYFEKY